ncbi:MAG: hypothetical protein FJ030_04500 [Chloroflexi bacterium]|nr:hypothetical protein [Chloroflexota bacterium]
MLDKLSAAVTRFAAGRNTLILLAVYLLINIVVLPAAEARIKAASGGVGPIDLQFGYTPDKVFGMVESYGDARSFYALFEFTGDLAYPIVYTLTFSFIITILFRTAFDHNSPLQKLHLLPFAAFAFDMLENVCIVTLLLTYPQQITAVAVVGNLFTLVKWAAAFGSLALILIGLVGVGVRKLKKA